MTETNVATAFDPVRVFRSEGLPTGWMPTFTADNGWTDALLAEVIGLARRSVAGHTALMQTVTAAGGTRRVMSVVACSRVLVNLADRMAILPSIGWSAPRALPWLVVAATAPTQESLRALMKAAAFSGSPTTPIAERGPEGLGLVQDWADVDPVLAPLAYAAGLSPVEALERQHAGTLTDAELRILARLRGYCL